MTHAYWEAMADRYEETQEYERALGARVVASKKWEKFPKNTLRLLERGESWLPRRDKIINTLRLLDEGETWISAQDKTYVHAPLCNVFRDVDSLWDSWVKLLTLASMQMNAVCVSSKNAESVLQLEAALRREVERWSPWNSEATVVWLTDTTCVAVRPGFGELAVSPSGYSGACILNPRHVAMGHLVAVYDDQPWLKAFQNT